MHDRLSPLLSRGSRTLSPRAQLAALGVLALILVALFVVVPWLTRPAAPPQGEADKTAAGEFRPTEAQWATLKTAEVQTRIFRAENVTDGKIAVNDDRTTPVFSPYTGRVTRVFAKPGDFVQQGAPLLAVEASEFVQGQNDLIAAVSTANTARAQLKLAQTNEKRQHELFEARGGALKDWQQSQVDLASVEGALRTAEIALAAARNRLRILGRSDQEIAAIESAHDLQGISPEAVMRAPISGTVLQRQVGLGQNIASTSNGGSTPVFSIGDLSTVWLVANVREEDAPKMHLDDPVEVHVLAYPGRVFKARLTYVAPSIDPATHRLPVRAEVENPDGALKPEMFASFSITTGESSTAPAVPESAVVYEGEAARVWVARDRRLALRPIRVGRISDGMVEVLAGLKPGETVVTSGALFIDRAAKGD